MKVEGKDARTFVFSDKQIKKLATHLVNLGGTIEELDNNFGADFVGKDLIKDAKKDLKGLRKLFGLK